MFKQTWFSTSLAFVIALEFLELCPFKRKLLTGAALWWRGGGHGVPEGRHDGVQGPLGDRKCIDRQTAKLRDRLGRGYLCQHLRSARGGSRCCQHGANERGSAVYAETHVINVDDVHDVDYTKTKTKPGA